MFLNPVRTVVYRDGYENPFFKTSEIRALVAKLKKEDFGESPVINGYLVWICIDNWLTKVEHTPYLHSLLVYQIIGEAIDKICYGHCISRQSPTSLDIERFLGKPLFDACKRANSVLSS